MYFCLYDLKKFHGILSLPVVMGRCDSGRLISVCASGTRNNFLLDSSSCSLIRNHAFAISQRSPCLMYSECRSLIEQGTGQGEGRIPSSWGGPPCISVCRVFNTSASQGSFLDWHHLPHHFHFGLKKCVFSHQFILCGLSYKMPLLVFPYEKHVFHLWKLI